MPHHRGVEKRVTAYAVRPASMENVLTLKSVSVLWCLIQSVVPTAISTTMPAKRAALELRSPRAIWLASTAQTRTRSVMRSVQTSHGLRRPLDVLRSGATASPPILK